jgi:hypothetical protein
VSLAALVVSISVMVVTVTGGGAVVVPFTSMHNCTEALAYVLKQASVSAAFCVDTSRVPAR